MDINVQELKEKFEKEEKFVLIDVRERHEHQDFNLGGALIPLGEIPRAIPELKEDYQDKEIVLYCRSGNRSGIAQELMLRAGFKNVRNLLGGVLAWKERYG
ncbi:MAG: rhodanese-like domain-containing protein [Saprospiraceae bacterium]|nr:rhodanese-like domain-containing protein [Saprospiraceae bacterium]MCB0627774.1 rhodanese-like domain-containing protein [Saprospiraceae bacterium]MCB0675418.1 rhodanese-like domain-containing protein [Saprospiraceae bacterium]MCB0682566.1 rhodanese-like domain-containing protein [Saprospiraceae bacterium]